jgi:L-ascorbate metabolism protein UlaG (beta-lactamase superfamily)
LKHVIASHYQWPSHPDVQAFLELMKAHTAAGEWQPSVVAPEPGETIELTP